MNLFLKRSSALMCAAFLMFLPVTVFAAESAENTDKDAVNATISDDIEISVLDQEEYQNYVSWRDDAVCAFTVEETSIIKISSDSEEDIVIIEYSDGEMETETIESGDSEYFYSGTIYFLCSESDLYIEEGVDYTRLFTSMMAIPLFFILPNMLIFGKIGERKAALNG